MSSSPPRTSESITQEVAASHVDGETVINKSERDPGSTASL